MGKVIDYRHLHRVLGRLGYSAREARDGHILYRHPDRTLFILLPDRPPQAVVEPLDLLRVRKALVNDGVVKDEEFDSFFLIKKGDRLIWTEPTTGRKTRVTAAAGESDGMVIIKQKGAFLPCPVGQLQKEVDVVPSETSPTS